MTIDIALLIEGIKKSQSHLQCSFDFKVNYSDPEGRPLSLRAGQGQAENRERGSEPREMGSLVALSTLTNAEDSKVQHG